MSDYCFGYASALYIYRHIGKQIARARRTEFDLSNAAVGIYGLKGTNWLEWLGERQVHVIACSPSDYRSCPSIAAHVWGKHCKYWPVLQLDHGIYVSSPEFLFLQMANVLDFYGLVFLGCELCGQYYFGERRIEERPRITSAAKIEQFLDQHPGTRGRDRALHALRYVIDGSASPMESLLALLLSMPVRMGGWGVRKPELNEKLPIELEASSVIDRDWITPDLLWKEPPVAVEYDSTEEHTGEERIANDSRRRLVFEIEGYKVITVTNEQMKLRSDLEAVARRIALATGKRVRKPSRESLEKRNDLIYRMRRLATHPELLYGI